MDFENKKCSKKGKVAIIGPGGYTGLAYYYHGLAESLQNDGWAVVLFTSNGWILNRHSRSYKLVTGYFLIDGSYPLVLKGLGYAMSSLFVFAKVMLLGAKIVHFQLSELPHVDWFWMWLYRALGRRVLFTPHDIPHSKSFPFMREFERLQYANSDVVVVHRLVNVETVFKRYAVQKSGIEVIPHGNYSYFLRDYIGKQYSRNVLKLGENENVALFFGNIKPNKGVGVFLDALRILVKSNMNIAPIIAGRPCGGVTSAWLEEALKERDLLGKVLVQDEFIPDEEVEFYYKASDVVILPYLKISESGVVRYAQSCGTPVICSDLPEFAEEVVDGENGYLFKSGDATKLAYTIRDFFQNGKKQEVAAASLRQAEKYSWQTVAKATGNVYERLIKLNGQS